MSNINQKSTFGIAKALHYIMFSREYLQDVIRQEKLKGYAKSVINNYINRLDWIVKDVFSRVNSNSANLLRQELKDKDIACIDSILNMAIVMNEDQREELEQYITDKYFKNETTTGN